MSKSWSSPFSKAVIAGWVAQSELLDGPKVAEQIRKNLLDLAAYRQVVGRIKPGHAINNVCAVHGTLTRPTATKRKSRTLIGPSAPIESTSMNLRAKSAKRRRITVGHKAEPSSKHE
ncbi:MAG TPA: hypothetical protein PLO16_13020 [Acidocella sp.]|nr:hypothetical protein [Acidocella sp.]